MPDVLFGSETWALLCGKKLRVSENEMMMINIWSYERGYNMAGVTNVLLECPKWQAKQTCLPHNHIWGFSIIQIPVLQWQKQHSTGRRLLTSKLGLNVRKKLVKCYVWSTALFGADTWTLGKVDQKYLECFEMWYWRKMEKVSWTDHVRNEEVLLTVKGERNILHTIKRGRLILLVAYCVGTGF